MTEYTGRTAEILQFLAALENQSISYTLCVVRPQALMVRVSVPGEQWDIEFTDEEEVEIEVFRSDGAILDARALDDLFRRFSD